MSESQKQELEKYQATVKLQEMELVEVRQQLAKLSEIVDRQTDDMKQLNAEARLALDNAVTARETVHQKLGQNFGGPLSKKLAAQIHKNSGQISDNLAN